MFSSQYFILYTAGKEVLYRSRGRQFNDKVHLRSARRRHDSKAFLKHATLKSEQIEGNMTYILFQLDNDTEVDVYRAKGRNGKI